VTPTKDYLVVALDFEGLWITSYQINFRLIFPLLRYS